eukprot:Phypoly_transcript_11648.p1 GENE.Phypoly_transcript_11648~~Phypoly_transcript_11648.p1  ORF type:complete len:350 (+),score=34.02 Phypoly_transcript_11648:42-1091(+)
MQALVSFFVLSLLAGCSWAQDSCATTPFDPTCAKYTPPDSLILNYTANLCEDMPGMTACYVNQLCTTKDSYIRNDKYCAPFSVYVDVCTTMRGMTDCSLFNSMCPNTSSLIEACYIPTLTLPSSSTVKNLSLTICSDPQMNMEPCSECNPQSISCNYFKMYSDLCISMPKMAQCAAWSTMCKDIPKWPLCSNVSPNNVIPTMRMYFHNSIVDYILFESWVPTTNASYVISWFAIFVFTVLYEVIKLVRTRLERKWADKLSEDYVNVNSSSKYAFLAGEAPFRPKIDFMRAFIHMIEVAWGFLVMLVVMTYNIGLCMAVLAGSFVGMLFIGSFEKRINVYFTYDPVRKDV